MLSFQPVIIGGDLGAYAIAREFNDAYGVKPIMVTAYNPNAIRDSAILTRRYCANASDEQALVDDLLDLGAQLRRQNPHMPVVLMANTDWRIRVMAKHREQLEAYYQLPIPPLEVIEQVMDKQGFERLATAQGMPVPRSFYEDFSQADDSNWTPQPVPDDLPFPVVAKPADSSQYENLLFEGRKKVYRIDSREELDVLWHTLADAGFRGTFVAQELVRGDDTGMYSVTAYVDSHGKVTMRCSAHVLLEEHHPATLGNPCAMITEPIPQILDHAQRFLESMPYHGFANFDVKRDSVSGKFYFFEINPRIGRNNFYVKAAGINPMEIMIRDIIGGENLPEQTADKEVLYSIIPDRLLRRYIVDPQLMAQVRRLQRAGRVNPQRNPKDASLKRRLYVLESELNEYRKFNRYYPKPTSTGF